MAPIVGLGVCNALGGLESFTTEHFERVRVPDSYRTPATFKTGLGTFRKRRGRDVKLRKLTKLMRSFR